MVTTALHRTQRPLRTRHRSAVSPVLGLTLIAASLAGLSPWAAAQQGNEPGVRAASANQASTLYGPVGPEPAVEAQTPLPASSPAGQIYRLGSNGVSSPASNVDSSAPLREPVPLPAEREQRPVAPIAATGAAPVAAIAAVPAAVPAAAPAAAPVTAPVTVAAPAVVTALTTAPAAPVAAPAATAKTTPSFIVAQAPGAGGANVPAAPATPQVQTKPAPPAPAPGAAPAASAAPAAPAAPVGPKFEIRSFEVEGSTLIAQDQFAPLLRPFIGAGKDFSDVQQALEAVEKLFVAQGFGSVQVLLPEQELEQGRIKFRVIEPKVARVLVEGNKLYNEANILASLPGLKPGDAPNSNVIAANLRLANENPGKATTVLLRAGSNDGEVDAVVKVTEDKVLKYSYNFDNTGTDVTGRGQSGNYRHGLGVTHANAFGLDHVFAAQVITSPQEKRDFRGGFSKDVLIVGLSYRIPFYNQGNMLDISAGYSNVSRQRASLRTPSSCSPPITAWPWAATA